MSLSKEPPITQLSQEDLKNLRHIRQKFNDLKAEKYLKEGRPRKEIDKICNEKALDRVLDSLEISYEELISDCQKHHMSLKLASMNISIQASRQGAIDESTIIKLCNETTSRFGVNIEQLSNDYARPHKHSDKIISRDEFMNGKGQFKKNDCLKSFDAEITGRIKGYVFAKVCIARGGHQDNVFEEAHCMCEWANKYGADDKIYVALIDTDLKERFEELESKYKDNSKVYVVDHVGLQKLLIK